MKELIRQQLIKKIEKEIKYLQEEKIRAKEAIEEQGEENNDSKNSNAIPVTASRNLLKLEEIQKQLEEFRNFKLNGNHSVSLGSLLSISFKSPTGRLESNNFFISPYFAGEQVIIDGKKISIINTNSDLFKNSKGKTVGDTFDMKISTAKITEIQ